MNDSIFRPHSAKQQEALLSNKKINLVATGVQWGKTSIGAMWLKRHIHLNPHAWCNFIVYCPTYKVMMQSTLPSFLKVMEGSGTYNKSDSVFKVHGGGTVYLRSATDPDSIIGITNCMALWADEAGKLTLYAYETLLGRSAFKNAPIILTTSPYTLNWIFKDVIRPYMKGLRHDEISYIKASSDENPYFPKEEYERRKRSMDPARFRMMFGGTWEKPEGLVYDFDEDRNICDPIQLSSGTRYFAAVDFGFRDPFCVIVRAVTPQGNSYEVREIYKSGLKPSEIVVICQTLAQTFSIERFFCDPSRPDMIAELNHAKLRAIPADNEIQKGIDKHYELINSGKYFIFKGECPNLIDEYSVYHYPEEIDLKPDQNQSRSFELPVDQSNHACDAVRYLTLGLSRSIGIYTAVVPGEAPKSDHPYDQFQRKIRRVSTPGEYQD